jgi:hypothetical protein
MQGFFQLYAHFFQLYAARLHTAAAVAGIKAE